MRKLTAAFLVVVVAFASTLTLTSTCFSAGDFNKPVTTQTYATVMSDIRAMFADLGKWLDGTNTVNPPHQAKRYNASTAIFEVYSGASPTWRPLATKYGINVDQVDGYHAGNSSGQIPLSNGTVNSTLNADQVDGYHAGNSSGQIPLSNGTINTNLNAEKVGGRTISWVTGTVSNIAPSTNSSVGTGVSASGKAIAWGITAPVGSGGMADLTYRGSAGATFQAWLMVPTAIGQYSISYYNNTGNTVTMNWWMAVIQ